MATTYTILTSAAQSNRSDIVIEFDISTGSNSADPSVSWRDIVAGLRAADPSVGTANSRRLGDGAYLTRLDSGEVYELALSVEYDANSSDAEKLAVIDAAVTKKVEEYKIEFKVLYEFYGYVRTVGDG